MKPHQALSALFISGLSIRRTQAQIFNPDKIQSFKYDINQLGNNPNGSSFGFSLTLIDDYEKMDKNFATNKNHEIYALIGAPRANPIDDDFYKGNKWSGGVNYCVKNKGQAIGSGSELDCSGQIKSLNGYNLQEKGDILYQRFNGYHINYKKEEGNSKSSSLLVCAPNSRYHIESKVQYDNAGICKKFYQGQSDVKEPINILLKSYSQGGTQKASGQSGRDSTMFGYATDFEDSESDSNGNGIIIGAPLGWNEKGFLSRYSKPNNQGKQETQIIDAMPGQKYMAEREDNFEDLPENYPRWGSTVNTFSCSGKKFVATSGVSNPIGKLMIFEYDKTDQVIAEHQVLQEKKFQKWGAKFGFAVTKLNLDSRPYLLVSSPFGQFGKLDLIDACTRTFVTNERLVNIPTDIKTFGYSLANIGDYDNLDGDEILVGAPNDDNDRGSLTLLATRESAETGKQVLTFVQTLKQKSGSDDDDAAIKHLGLAISKYTKDLDGLAGPDIFASGNEAVSAIPSLPFYSLSENMEILWENSKIMSSSSIPVFSHQASENFKVCLMLKSNMQDKLGKLINDNVKIKTKTLLTLDAGRSQETRRYSFESENGNTVKEIVLEQQVGKNLHQFCSKTLKIKAKEEYWSCRPDNTTTFISISDKIQFKLSKLESAVEFKNTNTKKPEKINMLETDYKMFKDMETSYVCKGPKNCIDQLSLSEAEVDPNSGDTIEISPSRSKVAKSIKLKVQNTGSQEIYGTSIMIQTSSPVIDITDNRCIKLTDLKFSCSIGCPISNSAPRTYSLDYEFQSVLGDTETYQMVFSLYKDGEIIEKSKIVKNFVVKTEINSVVSDTGSGQEISVNLPILANSIDNNLEFILFNDNEVISYDNDGMTVQIKVPVSIASNYNQGQPIHLFQRDDQNNYLYSFENREGGIWSCKRTANYKGIPSEDESTDHNTNILSVSSESINYDIVNCYPADILISGNQFKFIFKSKIKTDIFEKINNRVVSYKLNVLFKVEKIKGLDYTNVPSTPDEPGKTSEIQQTFSISGLPDQGGSSKMWILWGNLIGLGVILLILGILYFTGFFKKELVFHTEPQAEGDSDNVQHRVSQEEQPLKAGVEQSRV